MQVFQQQQPQQQQNQLARLDYQAPRGILHAQDIQDANPRVILNQDNHPAYYPLGHQSGQQDSWREVSSNSRIVLTGYFTSHVLLGRN